MSRRLPRWVLSGAAVLAFIAGMINTVGFLGYQHHGLTHMTSNTVSLSLEAVGQHPSRTVFFGVLLLAFAAGCVLSGLITGGRALRHGRYYGSILFLESLILVVAVLVLQLWPNAGLWLVAGAAGLQNGMAATYRGATVRTSHMTGIITDLGTYLGRRLRGGKGETYHLVLHCLLLGGFVAGGVTGGFVYLYAHEYTLFICAAISASAGLAYMVHRRSAV
jgi:uncharacterized membrane protein YoaK (UPF0700 family)